MAEPVQLTLGSCNQHSLFNQILNGGPKKDTLHERVGNAINQHQDIKNIKVQKK